MRVRPVLAFLACCSFSCAVLAQPARPDVSLQARLQVAAQAKALMAALEEDMGRQDAALDAARRDATARAGWSEQEGLVFLGTLLRSRTNQAFDRQITALTEELRGMLQALQRGEIKGEHADARFLMRTREIVRQLRAVYGRQSVYLVGQLRDVKPVQRR